MSITIEQIDELRKRAKVNYTHAKEALEKCNGDILEALVYLENNNKGQTSEKSRFAPSASDKIKALVKKGSDTKCIMYNGDKTIFNLSLNLVVLITFFTLPFLEFIIFGLIIALFTGCKIKFEKCGGEEMKINQTLQKVYSAVDDIKQKNSAGTVCDDIGKNK